MPDRDDDGIRLTGKLIHVLDGDGVDLVVGVQATDVFPEEGGREGRRNEQCLRWWWCRSCCRRTGNG